MPKVAIIGAGLSGLVVARRLQGTADVHLFEKSRGAGGRMATRYAGEFEFDHGTQFFTARTKEFQAFLSPLIEAGIVADWSGPFAEFDHSELKSIRPWDEHYPHYVGTPRMNRIGKELSKELDIRFETTISGCHRDDEGWTLADATGATFGPYDWLVVTAPAAQTATLGEPHEDLGQILRGPPHARLLCPDAWLCRAAGAPLAGRVNSQRRYQLDLGEQQQARSRCGFFTACSLDERLGRGAHG